MITIQLSREKYMEIPDSLEWFIPYVGKLLKSGYKFPEQIITRKPTHDRRMQTYASASVSDMSDWRGVQVSDCNIFVYTHNKVYTQDRPVGFKKFYKKTMLSHLAHEFAHIQSKKAMTHGQEWQKYHKEILGIFAKSYGKPLKIDPSEFEFDNLDWIGKTLYVNGRGAFVS
jgi:hypothetical protein